MSRKRNSRMTGAARRSRSTDAEPRRLPTPQRKLLATAVAGCLMLGAPAAFSQSAGSNLRGQVRTVSGPAANTEVVATNVATGVTRRTRTSEDGRYVLIGLDPGTWTVQAGGTTQVVTLSVASNSTLNLEAGEGAGPADLDTITVVGQQAQLDVLTSEVGTTVSPRLIEQLPQATRNFLEFADTVPGMAFTVDPQGFTSLRGGALSNNTSNLYIDGVGQKSYVAAGGVAGQTQTRGNPFPQLAIDQYKVITSNYKAEYGQVAGAALTAVTRSGTNEFEAEAYYRFTNESLREKRPDEKLPDAEKVDSQTEEYGFAIGGPIIEDRLHYFLAYEYKDLITPRSVTPDSAASDFVQFLPADVQAQFGATDQPFEEDLVFGKLSWALTDSDLLELSLQYRDEVQVDSVGDRRSAEHGRDVINKDERVTLRWERSADTWFNEVLFGIEDSENNPFPTGIGTGIIYAVLERNPDGSVAAERTLIETGPSSGFDARAQKQDGWLIADNLTFTGFDWYGEHTVKLGVSYKDLELTFQDAGAINPQFKFEVDTTGVASQPYRVDFLSRFLTSQSPLVVSDTKQYGFYIQDDWAVNEHLILNVGIRWDYEKNPAYTDFVTSQDFVNDLFAEDAANPGHPWADRLLPSGMNANDYVSTGDNRDDYSDAWAPRLGFSYDIFADERHVIHGGAGRSYDRNLFSILSLEVTKAALSPVAVYFQDPVTGECYRDDGRPCVAWDPQYLSGGIPALSAIPVTQGSAELFMLNNNLKTPYADQYSLGIASEIGEWRTDLTVQRILAYDGFIFTLINRYPDGSFFQNGSQPWGEPVPGWANTILGSNGIESRNTQVLLSANKPYDRDSGWGVSLAYTFTDAKHNRQVGDNFAFDKPTINEYPFIRANDVPEHRFVAAGTIDGPWDTIFGAKIVLETPRPINQIRDYGNRPPDGSFSQPVTIVPPGTGSFLIGGDIWGYRTVDFQATKVFTIGDHELTARVNLLNAFDYENFSTFNVPSVGGGGVLDPVVEVNEFGNILYVPRTLSFEVGYRF